MMLASTASLFTRVVVRNGRSLVAHQNTLAEHTRPSDVPPIFANRTSSINTSTQSMFELFSAYYFPLSFLIVFFMSREELQISCHQSVVCNLCFRVRLLAPLVMHVLCLLHALLSNGILLNVSLSVPLL